MISKCGALEIYDSPLNIQKYIVRYIVKRGNKVERVRDEEEYGVLNMREVEPSNK